MAIARPCSSRNTRETASRDVLNQALKDVYEVLGLQPTNTTASEYRVRLEEALIAVETRDRAKPPPPKPEPLPPRPVPSPPEPPRPDPRPADPKPPDPGPSRGLVSRWTGDGTAADSADIPDDVITALSAP